MDGVGPGVGETGAGGLVPGGDVVRHLPMGERAVALGPLDQVVEAPVIDRRAARHQVTAEHGPQVDQRPPQAHGSGPVLLEQEAHGQALGAGERFGHDRRLAVVGEGLAAHGQITLPPQAARLYTGQRIGDGDKQVAGDGVGEHEVHRLLGVGHPVVGHRRLDGLAQEVDQRQPGGRPLRVVEDGVGPLAGRAVERDPADADAVYAEGRCVRLRHDHVDRARQASGVDPALPGPYRLAGQGRLDQRHHRCRDPLRSPAGSVDQAGQRRAQLGADPDLGQQRQWIGRRPDLGPAQVEQRARDTAGRVERGAKLVDEAGQLVVGNRGGAELGQQRRALVDPGPDLPPVVVEAFHQCLGLQEGVAGDGQHPEGVDLHPRWDP